MPVTVPPSLLIVLQVLRPCFTAPSFVTLAARVHWSRAHRFFARAVWDLDQVGLALARAVVARLVPDGGAVTVAVDDTLFHRYGKKVHGAKYQHDGSARGRDGIGRGNCFVIVGVVAAVPFLARQVCLPVLLAPAHPQDGSVQYRAGPRHGRPPRSGAARAHHPRGGDAPPARTGLARPAHPRHFTTRLAANAVLHRPEPGAPAGADTPPGRANGWAPPPTWPPPLRG